jgi:hypothetical protein
LSRCDQVALGDHSSYVPAHYEHWYPADTVLDEQPGDALERRDPVDGDNVGGHHVPDPAVELPVMLVQLVMGCLAGRRLWLLGLRVRRLPDMPGHLFERPADVAGRGTAVQRVVVRRAEVAQHGIEMLVLASH